MNNWNERRKDHILEKKLLIELNWDFTENKKRFKLASSAHKYANKSILELIEYFPNQLESTPFDSVHSKLIKSLERNTYNTSQGTINAMISNSTFNLIQNTELRRLLISWSDWVKDFQEDEIESRTHAETFLVPLLNESLLWLNDLNDPRNDLDVLTSVEFENVMRQRIFFLRDVAQDEEHDLIEDAIDRIITLKSEFASSD